MTKINKLNDIEIYRQALDLAQKIYKLTRIAPLSRDFSLVDQIKRASLSTAANIAEGYGRKTKKDFSQFLSIALGSTNEIIAYLDFISLEYKINATQLANEYNILAKRIYKFRTYLLITHHPPLTTL